MFRIVLYAGGKSKIFNLPDTDKATVIMAPPSEETGVVTFMALAGEWYIVKPEGMQWGDLEDTWERHLQDKLSLILKRETVSVGIYCSKIEDKDIIFRKYRIPDGLGSVMIGRQKDCAICSCDPRISDHHGEITFADGVTYEDRSKNGSFVDGELLYHEKRKILTGNIISFADGLQVIYLGSRMVGISGVGNGSVGLERAEAADIPVLKRENQPLYSNIQRPPRFMPGIVEKKFELEATPVEDTGNKTPLLLSMGPALTMSIPMLLGSFLTGNGYRGAGVIMIVGSSALAVMWSIANNVYGKYARRKQYRAAMEDYIKRLGRTEKEIEDGVSEILDTMERYYPDWRVCCSETEKLSSVLWERTPESDTFLKVRIGRGQVRLPYSITVPKLKMGEVPEGAAAAPYELQGKFSNLHDAPVTVDLQRDRLFGIVSADAAGMIRSIVLQLAVLHAPCDLRIAIIAKAGHADKWRELRTIPHVQVYGSGEGQLIADGYSDAMEILSLLNNVLMLRSEKKEGDNGSLPRYVVIFEDTSCIGSHVLVSNILSLNAGFSVCVCAANENDLPKECRKVFNAYENRLYDLAGCTERAITPEYAEERSASRTFGILSALRETGVLGNSSIPDRVTFLEMYGVKRTGELGIRRRWEFNSTSRDIIAYLGKSAGGHVFPLDISDKQHGPHGIMAGTTGSGKSVLLQTLLLSLALNYSPEQMQFIMIDYKGGGSFNSFKNMPHSIGFIDNLQGKRSINRALYSVRGEVKRREALFKQYDVDNIDAYIKYVNPLADSKKLAHILIVIDEFSEMMDEMPDFMSELISTARVGRSVGLHMLLATQRPSNKVGPEIWSNSRFHICLQVRTREDSNDMLHRPDAAFIRGNGRGFVQVGNDELFEQIQTAYCGADYNPDEPDPDAKPVVTDSLGRKVKTVKASAGKDRAHAGKAKSQMEAVLEEIGRTAELSGYRLPGNLWLPELPGIIDIDRVPQSKAQFPDSIPVNIGLMDDVINQRYLPAFIDLAAARCIALIGHAQSGKTTFLQSIVYDISRDYSPEQVQVLILSFAGTVLQSLTAVPNVCDALSSWDAREHRAAYYRLEELISQRDAVFAGKKTDSFASYNRSCLNDGEACMPALVVMVDRYAQWCELLNDTEKEKLDGLIKTAAGRGVYFILTATDQSEIGSRMLESMQVIPLGMSSPAEYAGALGVRTNAVNADPADIPGRGMMNTAYGCMEFQTGIAFGQQDDRLRSVKIEAYGKGLEGCSSPAIRMPRVPAEFGAAVLERYRGSDPMVIPAAFTCGALKPVFFDMFAKNVVLVAGKRETGRSSYLRALAGLCAGDDGDIFVMAGENERSKWQGLNERTVFMPYTTPVEAQRDFVSRLDDIFGEHKKCQKSSPYCDDKQHWREIAGGIKPLCIVLDDADKWFSQPRLDQQLAMLLSSAVRLGSKYNICILLSAEVSSHALSENIAAFCGNCQIIATGNTLSVNDPWNCSLPYDRQNEFMKPGEGFVVPESRFPVKVYLPKE